MKTCEICGRPIKTGRKYCWEHRHTSQAETLRGDRIINEATEGYHKYHEIGRKKLVIILLISFFIYVIIILSIFGFGSNIAMILSLLGGLFIFLVLPSVIRKYLGIKAKEKIQIEKEIQNRDPKYVEWVKGWVKDEKEEKEFRKSLLK